MTVVVAVVHRKHSGHHVHDIVQEVEIHVGEVVACIAEIFQGETPCHFFLWIVFECVLT